jgi:small GTP-binding protein
VVFDAYRRKDHKEERYPWHNLFVVYTKTAQTADSYIESFSGRHAASDIVTVATSDGVEQIIVRSQGALLLSASDLREEMLRAHSEGLSNPAMTEAAPKNRPFADKLKRPESSEEAP